MSRIEAAFFGTLGKDAEAKTSGSGKSYARLNLRVGDGDKVQWISVTTFDQKAIDAIEKLVKGAAVYVEGQLSLDEWTGQDGAKRHSLSVVSWHCRLSQIGRNRPRRDARPKAANSGSARAASSDCAPIGAPPPDGHPAFNDDIPF